MKLILIRHGKAEELNIDVNNNSERELTEKGHTRIKEEAQGLKNSGLLTKRRLHIWSSPLPRARQTAEIMASIFEVEKIIEHEAIAKGELDALTLEMNRLEEDDCLIVVGHEPFLGQWCACICQVSLAFKKGAAACIKLKSKTPLSGELAWFMQPGAIIRLRKKR